MILGCYRYRSLCGFTVVHVFTGGGLKCGCGHRILRRAAEQGGVIESYEKEAERTYPRRRPAVSS